MYTKYIFIFLLLHYFSFYGQDCVSGYINFENPEQWEEQVYLSRINLEDNLESDSATIIGTAPIQKDGFFTFNNNFFNVQDRIYKVHVNRLRSKEKVKINNTFKNYKFFILSNKDTLRFQKGKEIFAKYITSNKADKEWQKLKRFEAKYENTDNKIKQKLFLKETKGYIKDSLQILLVKLISIKKLEDNNLLEKDIKADQRYYLDLLNELKSSELDPKEYVYLENKVALVNQEITYRKYQISLLINSIALLVIIGLVVFIFRSRIKVNREHPVLLSKQEKTIKALILEGKSNKEIANELFISLSTVKTHITNLYNKLGVSNRNELLLK